MAVGRAPLFLDGCDVVDLFVNRDSLRAFVGFIAGVGIDVDG
jgi:hypothetical protein